MEENKKKSSKAAYWLLGGIIIVCFVFVLSAVSSVANQPDSSSGSSAAPTTQTVNSQAQSPCAAYSDTNTLMQNATTLNYKQLEKNPNSFSGTVAGFTGKVVQILESDGQGVIRLAVTKDSFGDWDPGSIVYVTYDGHNDAVNDDIVSVYGPITGSQTYTSQANYQITVPSMVGCFVTKKTANATATTPKTLVAPAAKIPAASSTPTPQPQATPATWHTVTTITTATTKNTPPFTIQGSQWRATWSCQASIWGQYDSAPLVSARATTGFGGGAVAEPNTCPSGDTTYFYSPGTYYLDINIYSPATMTVTIEDYY